MTREEFEKALCGGHYAGLLAEFDRLTAEVAALNESRELLTHFKGKYEAQWDMMREVIAELLDRKLNETYLELAALRKAVEPFVEQMRTVGSESYYDEISIEEVEALIAAYEASGGKK